MQCVIYRTSSAVVMAKGVCIRAVVLLRVDLCDASSRHNLVLTGLPSRWIYSQPGHAGSYVLSSFREHQSGKGANLSWEEQINACWGGGILTSQGTEPSGWLCEWGKTESPYMAHELLLQMLPNQFCNLRVSRKKWSAWSVVTCKFWICNNMLEKLKN